MLIGLYKFVILWLVCIQSGQGSTNDEVPSVNRRHSNSGGAKNVPAALKSLEGVLKAQLSKLGSILKDGFSHNKNPCKQAYKNCVDVLKCGGKKNGVYTVKPSPMFRAFKVYCDQTTDGGGWTVFQKRQDGSVDFYRAWSEYKRGFGHVSGEFWLGLDKINLLSHQTRNRLRVDLMDWDGTTKYAEYSYFAVAAEKSKYALGLGSYSGTAGDSLSYHRGAPFTTKDQDNDTWPQNCAVYFKGAWWHKDCFKSHLNGPYRQLYNGHAVDWHNTWKASLKHSEMKMRPADFSAK